jgi:LAO/AO transport system kinase
MMSIPPSAMNPGNRPPEWAEGGKGMSSGVMPGVKGGHDGLPGAKLDPKRFRKKRPGYTEQQLLDGVRAGDRTILGRVISLVESNASYHMDLAQRLLKDLLPDTGNALRIGITGVPGAGKSTFIDSFGTMLTAKGHKVAVLAVDPSSTMTRGSILGDKTRMEQLSRDENAFIRPSPSGGTLGGVGRKTRETMLVCEAAGFDVILIETVGVGQSEAAVRSMSDLFLLLTLTGAGDELQGIKRGVMENADAIVVNKADGDNRLPAERLANELSHALSYLRNPTPGWETKTHLVSAREKTGLEELWDMLTRFKELTTESGELRKRRSAQAIEWMMGMVVEEVQKRFLSQTSVREALPVLKNRVAQGQLPATSAARELLGHLDHFCHQTPKGNP